MEPCQSGVLISRADKPGAPPPDPGDIFEQMKGEATSFVQHLCDQALMVLRHNLCIACQFFRSKMM